MNENGYFGVVRWCNDDIAVRLEEMGIDANDGNIATVRKNLENNVFFESSMIEAGWSVIDTVIQDTLGEWEE